MGKGVGVGGHPIDRCHRAERQRIIISAPVAHNAHGFHWQDRGKSLPDVIIKPVFANLVDVDGISAAQNIQLFCGNLARATDGKARAREGMAADKGSRQAQLAPQGAHFVFVQFSQRFDQL